MPSVGNHEKERGPGQSDQSYEAVRRRVAGGIVRGLSAASLWVVKGARWGDRALQGLDLMAGRGRDRFLGVARIDRAGLAVKGFLEGFLEASPPWVARPVTAVGHRLNALGRWLLATFSFLPREREWKQAAAGLALLLAVVTIGSFRQPPQAEPLPSAWSPLVIGYFENGWGGYFRDSYPTLQRRAERIDMVMPFWYSLHPTGDIEDRGARSDVVDWAQRSGIKVVPLINNAKVGTNAGFLVDPAAREQATAGIRSLVDGLGYDGVHLDFELLPAEWRDLLTSFVAEVRATLGPDRHLSVAVFPQVDVPADVSGAYDYAALSDLCDFLVIMGYDMHYAGGPPGPVSPDPWIEANIRHALLDLGVPVGKVVLGVGAYGYDWTVDGPIASSVPARYVPDVAQQVGAAIRFDEASGNPYLTYHDTWGNKHELWYQDERVMATRIRQARQYGLAGIALWRLGYESAATWSVITGELGAKARRAVP